MAYIPPHKRHSGDMGKPSPQAELLSPLFHRNLNLRPVRSKGIRNRDIVYANQAISKWFCVGSTGIVNGFPSFVNLEPFAVESIEHIRGQKPLALVNTNVYQGIEEEEGEVVMKPWESIVENVLNDLLSTIERVKDVMDQDLEEVRPKLVIRLGKVLFDGCPERNKDEFLSETMLKKRIFYTNVSNTYVNHIIEQVIPSIGVEFEKEKDIFHVKLSDAARPGLIISCRCVMVPELNNLELYNIELNNVRQMVVDISCLRENLDVRLMLSTKKILTNLTDDEMEIIENLLKSAVADPDIKGGLRWPLGKSCSGNRFRVSNVWHTVAKSYTNPSVRLKVRNADRYDFRTTIGEATREVTLKLKQVTTELLEGKAGKEVIANMLNDQLKLVWNHFLHTASCSPPFVSA